VAVKVIKTPGNTSLAAMRRVSCASLIVYRPQLSQLNQKVNREREVWAALNHPNILRFYGFAEDKAFEPFGALISPVRNITHSVTVY
jgi:serine/threonine protein kinase